MNGLIGVVVGGSIALMSTVVVDWLRYRRTQQHRWDERGFEELRSFIAATNLTIGALYDRGLSMTKYGQNSDKHQLRTNQARSAYDSFRVAEACALMANPGLRPEIEQVKSALEAIKTQAERGFDRTSAGWVEGQADAVVALDDLTRRAGDFYGVRDPKT